MATNKNFQTHGGRKIATIVYHTLHKSPDIRINVDLPISEEGNALWARCVVNYNTVTMPRKRVGTYIIICFKIINHVYIHDDRFG